MISSPAPLAALRGVWKVFESVPVLRGIDFEIRPGEVHALLGGNGSGKSTLVKIISGAYQPTEGRIEIGGEAVVLAKPSEAHARGVYMVPQEPHIFPSLSVLENLTMGLPGGMAANEAEATRIAREIGLNTDPDAAGGELSIANQQLVEIVRGLLRKARVLILDEPTSSLTRREVSALASEMKALTSRGIGILFISHRLDEVIEFSDRVSVLRDGRFVLSEPARSLTADKLIEAMLPADFTPAAESRDAERHTGRTPVLKVSRLTGRAFREVSFEVLPGEVVGIAGVVGSGRTELAEGIYGIDTNVTGDVEIDGKPATARTPSNCQSLGLSYVPEDRHAHGIFLTLSCARTIAAGLLSLGRSGFLAASAEARLTRDYVDRLRIKLNSPEQIARTLSGGNQQKVVLAKILAPEPRIVILDEPTRGIDARARQDVYRIIRELTDRGVGVVVISSEVGEVSEISNRVLVMRGGRLSMLQAGRRTVEDISNAIFHAGGREAA